MNIRDTLKKQAEAGKNTTSGAGNYFPLCNARYVAEIVGAKAFMSKKDGEGEKGLVEYKILEVEALEPAEVAKARGAYPLQPGAVVNGGVQQLSQKFHMGLLLDELSGITGASKDDLAAKVTDVLELDFPESEPPVRTGPSPLVGIKVSVLTWPDVAKESKKPITKKRVEQISMPDGVAKFLAAL